MWYNPTEIDITIMDFCRKLSCDWVGAVIVDYHAAYNYDDCHNNVKLHVDLYGGESVIGWYIVSGFNTLQAIRHTVWKYNNQYIDITPYKDRREYIIFSKSKNQTPDYKLSNCYAHSVDKYFMQESELMYYIYQLVDPRTNIPFYIGKGTGRRASTHLWSIPETRNRYKENKIADIRSCGIEPLIVYLAENIIDEQLAYDMETSLIKLYGRKGYEDGGILTNVCIDNRPPNHKGKTYEQIYGIDRAVIERKKRSDLQLARGGYGPRIHSVETRKKISLKSSGSGNGMYGKNQSDDTIKKIKENRTPVTGVKHHASKHWQLISPDGQIYETIGGLVTLCKTLGLSFATMSAAYRYNRVPVHGKSAGWKIQTLND